MAHTSHIEPAVPFIEHAPDDNVVDMMSASSQLTSFSGGYGLSNEQLRELSTRELRVMINRVFTALDSTHPPYGSLDLYETLVELIEERAQEATRSSDEPVREGFRDNALNRRFELHIDGTLAAYLKYRIMAGRITLIEGAKQPDFCDQGVEATLLRHVFLNTHRRRLSVVPLCPMVFAFLADHPEYQVLAASGTAPSAHLRY